MMVNAAVPLSLDEMERRFYDALAAGENAQAHTLQTWRTWLESDPSRRLFECLNCTDVLPPGFDEPWCNDACAAIFKDQVTQALASEHPYTPYQAWMHCRELVGAGR
jgi:hypothetical protein